MSTSRTFAWNPQKHCIYISLGSNIRAEENIPRAVAMLGKFGQVIGTSTVWETTPVGTSGPSFLNAVVLFQANHPPAFLRSLVLRRIEYEMGRLRTFNKYAPRSIDLDILIADGKIIEPGIWTHAYLAVPLAELLPDLQHPYQDLKLAQVAKKLLQLAAIHPHPEVKINIGG